MDNSKNSNSLSNVLNEMKGYYFEAYSSLESHEVMIKDSIRTMAYKRAVDLNKHLFKDKIVLDVGCGLGILSLFAASAGAKTIISIDASDMAIYAEKVVRHNKFDNIFVIKAKVEEVERLPDGIEKVDVIISEWMGVCLYHESMLGTVLYARDKWLKKDGLLFPDKVQMFVGGIDDSKRQKNGFDNWINVYGYNLSYLQNIIYKEPTQEIIEPKQVITDFAVINDVDLYKASSQFTFNEAFQLTVNRDCTFGGFVTYFDTIFTKCHKPVVLSTSPSHPVTHWRQTVFYFRDHIQVQSGDEIKGTFFLDQFRYNFRDLEIKISAKHEGKCFTQYFSNEFILR